MSIQDPIANLFSSINNAQARSKEFVKVPSSTKKTSPTFNVETRGLYSVF